MLVEDYNGTCPKCGFDRMDVRYGSEGYFRYDACSKCGFAYGTYWSGKNYEKLKQLKDEKCWKIIIENVKETLEKRGLPITREGYHQFILSLPEPTERLKHGSIFVHGDKK